MDLFPLWNSLRVAGIAMVATFFIGMLIAYYVERVPRLVRGALDVLLTLPLVLPPTVIGFFLLILLGRNGYIGQYLPFRLAMQWYSAVFSSFVVSIPLMYRTMRGSFAAFDKSLRHAGQTLGMSNTRIFWRVTIPNCRSGVISGTVLAFARALGEYGATSMFAGYIKGKTATISTTVYALWKEGTAETEALAYKWVLVNIAISVVVLFALNFAEGRSKKRA